MASKVAALLLLGIVCFWLAAADVPVDCCLKTSNKHFPASHIASYKFQDAGQGCGIRATVLITKAGRKLCLAHPDGNKWVRKLLDEVDKKIQAQ